MVAYSIVMGHSTTVALDMGSVIGLSSVIVWYHAV